MPTSALHCTPGTVQPRHLYGAAGRGYKNSSAATLGPQRVSVCQCMVMLIRNLGFSQGTARGFSRICSAEFRIQTWWRWRKVPERLGVCTVWAFKGVCDHAWDNLLGMLVLAVPGILPPFLECLLGSLRWRVCILVPWNRDDAKRFRLH